MDLRELREKIAVLAQNYPKIILVYLFGSRVPGHTGPLSDFDFYVIGLSPYWKPRLLWIITRLSCKWGH